MPVSCATPWTSSGCGSPAASASTAFGLSATAVCENRVRVVASENAVDAGGRTGSASARRAAEARSAGSDLAESTSGTSAGSSAGSAGSGSPCSMITCALVPLTPNDDTPARRGDAARGHGADSVSSATAPEAQSTCGLGAGTCSVAGSSSCRSACTILMTPATPAAAWVCPMFDLTDPRCSGVSLS